ncbi:MAG: hypothetical protein ACTSUX_11010, partial [Promethearchaeota archaeon]
LILTQVFGFFVIMGYLAFSYKTPMDALIMIGWLVIRILSSLVFFIYFMYHFKIKVSEPD